MRLFAVQSLFVFVSDDVPRFRLRGALQFRGGKENGVYLSQNQLSEKDRSTLKVRRGKRGYLWLRKGRMSC